MRFFRQALSSSLQNEKSNLVNAYKKNEIDKATGLGLFMLSSIIVDKAEPSEALMATTVWSGGIPVDHYLLSDRQLNGFRLGESVHTEDDVKAEPGCYFIQARLELKAGNQAKWSIVSDVNQSHSDVVALIHRLKQDESRLLESLDRDVVEGTRVLKELVGLADGHQLTGDELGTGRHYSNVLFNIMRGGIFDDQYRVESSDLSNYARCINRKVRAKNEAFFTGFPAETTYQDVLSQAKKSGDPDLIRICHEYLPLTFSRRHGDPSRPWNKFSIETKKADGSRNRHYQGNWRDIFQNWEALAFSFPVYLESMITKFLNASTLDGYNPYRITREGVDWEVIDPDDPWSYIGYWGDHQIIYLLKLLELYRQHNPSGLMALLSESHFVYANVPYLIKSYDDILRTPKDTIAFDAGGKAIVQERVREIGADGKLAYVDNGQLVRGTLTEKLLVTLLAKLSNFIPEAGIWLNTQRPEWNDANNALVGNGVSMVTLYYLRRFVGFCIETYSASGEQTFCIRASLAQQFSDTAQCFTQNQGLLKEPMFDRNRKQILDQLGRIGEAYRESAYATSMQDTKTIDRLELVSFLKHTNEFIDHSIRANRRADGLYHSYNLVRFPEDCVCVEPLYEMLEGQVAVLSSGLLNKEESLTVLNSLQQSRIFRADHGSYMLYPDRELPRFLEKNRIPNEFIDRSVLAHRLLQDEDQSLLSQDVEGSCHFNGSFTNIKDLCDALDRLKHMGYHDEVASEYLSYLEIFEKVFDHVSFTGRSGTFFGYEGLGSIYWHMVSKLLLAVQEIIYAPAPADTEVQGKLIDHYHRIREGIGVHKSPAHYGAFPTDPYSHTPGHRGAQQPGMTGQVKEDILNRWAELGVRIQNGTLVFRPLFLSQSEFLEKPGVFEYVDCSGTLKQQPVEARQLAFTLCLVPIIYVDASDRSIEVLMEDDTIRTIDGCELPPELSHSLFNRSGRIKRITVQTPVS